MHFVRVRVLRTDYCSPWVRELTRALLPGSESFAPADPLWSDDLDDVYSIASCCLCDCICFYMIVTLLYMRFNDF